jgi:hypothetical protein
MTSRYMIGWVCRMSAELKYEKLTSIPTILNKETKLGALYGLSFITHKQGFIQICFLGVVENSSPGNGRNQQYTPANFADRYMQATCR